MRWPPLQIIHGTGCLGQWPEPYVWALQDSPWVSGESLGCPETTHPQPAAATAADGPSHLRWREQPCPSPKRWSRSKLPPWGKAFPALSNYLHGSSALGTQLDNIESLRTSSPSPGFSGQLTFTIRSVVIDLHSIQCAQGFTRCLSLSHHP